MAVGFLVGVAARVWMRLVSSDPEFSWAGTIGIVGLFTIAGLTQGLALGTRRRGWSRRAQTPVRVLAAIGGLLLGSSAGIVMLPALISGSLAIGRTDWSLRARSIADSVALLNAIGVGLMIRADLWRGRAGVGWLAMLVLYTAIIGGRSLNLRPLDDGWRVGRRAWVGLLVVAAGLGAFVLVGAMFGI
ncbi:MAG: hypothetical protein H0U21_01900 [Acidimicrobiia bacterium]|nr:hypothetical protein [Acidimicrobiia bacterium]